jgi:integrase
MLFKRPGSRYYQVKLKHRGRVIKRSTGTTVKSDAQRFQERLRGRLQNIRETPAGAYTFNDAAIRWLDKKSKKRSLKRDVEIIAWLKPHIGDTLLSEITRDVVEALREKKSLERTNRSGRPCSEQTVNRYMALLRSILRIARDDWEWLSKIPKVPMYEKEDEDPPRWLTHEEVRQLLPELPAHTRQAGMFSLETGLRSRPIRLLQWDWIARDGLHLPAKVMKSAKHLTIPFSMTAWHILSEQWGQHPKYVFTYEGEYIRGKFTTAAWYKAIKRANLPGVRFHDFRHTWASRHAQNGTPMEVVQKLGGWSSYEAMRIYAQFSPASLGAWADNASKGTQCGATEKVERVASV